jgi:hypothetical protein
VNILPVPLLEMTFRRYHQTSDELSVRVTQVHGKLNQEGQLWTAVKPSFILYPTFHQPPFSLLERMAVLSDLSNDILLLIIDMIEDKICLYNISFTCRGLYDLTRPYRYRSIEFPISVVKSKTNETRLDFIPKKKTLLLHRTLTEKPELRAYSHALLVSFQIANWDDIFAFELHSEEKIASFNSSLHASLYWSALMDFISWFCNLRSLAVRNENIPGRLLEKSERLVYQRISQMENLESLDLYGGIDITPTVLSNLLHPRAKLISLELQGTWASGEVVDQPMALTTDRDSYVQEMLGSLQNFELNVYHSINTWIEILPKFKKLRVLEMTSQRSAIEAIIRSRKPTSTHSLLSLLLPLTDLRELTLNLWYTDFSLQLCDLQISQLPSIMELNLSGWFFSLQTSALDIYETLLAGGLRRLYWHYAELTARDIAVKGSMISVLRQAFLHSHELQYVRLELHLYDSDEQRVLEVKQELSRLEQEVISKGMQCQCHFATSDMLVPIPRSP